MKILEILKAIFLGIVEGITEWLPVTLLRSRSLTEEIKGERTTCPGSEKGTATGLWQTE